MFTPEAVYISRRELVARLVFWFVMGVATSFAIAMILLTIGAA